MSSWLCDVHELVYRISRAFPVPEDALAVFVHITLARPDFWGSLQCYIGASTHSPITSEFCVLSSPVSKVAPARLQFNDDSGNRLVVDFAFKRLFEIPRKARSHLVFMARLDSFFCGTQRDLCASLRAAGQSVSDAFVAMGLSLPPWRSTNAVLRLYASAQVSSDVVQSRQLATDLTVYLAQKSTASLGPARYKLVQDVHSFCVAGGVLADSASSSSALPRANAPPRRGLSARATEAVVSCGHLSHAPPPALVPAGTRGTPSRLSGGGMIHNYHSSPSAAAPLAGSRNADLLAAAATPIVVAKSTGRSAVAIEAPRRGSVDQRSAQRITSGGEDFGVVAMPAKPQTGVREGGRAVQPQTDVRDGGESPATGPSPARRIPTVREGGRAVRLSITPQRSIMMRTCTPENLTPTRREKGSGPICTPENLTPSRREKGSGPICTPENSAPSRREMKNANASLQVTPTRKSLDQALGVHRTLDESGKGAFSGRPTLNHLNNNLNELSSSGSSVRVSPWSPYIATEKAHTSESTKRLGDSAPPRCVSFGPVMSATAVDGISNSLQRAFPTIPSITPMETRFPRSLASPQTPVSHAVGRNGSQNYFEMTATDLPTGSTSATISTPATVSTPHNRETRDAGSLDGPSCWELSRLDLSPVDNASFPNQPPMCLSDELSPERLGSFPSPIPVLNKHSGLSVHSGKPGIPVARRLHASLTGSGSLLETSQQL